MIHELWTILSKITEWVKYSDTKAVLLLTLHGVVLTLIYSNANSIYNFIFTNWLTGLLSILIFTSSFISIIYSFLVVNPRLRNENPTSIIYFGHIQARFKNYLEYYQMAKSILKDEDKMNEQLAEQIHINSIIAWKKFTYIAMSIRFYFISIALFSVTLLYYFFSK